LQKGDVNVDVALCTLRRYLCGLPTLVKTEGNANTNTETQRRARNGTKQGRKKRKNKNNEVTTRR
jgi:hypothetical protein